ncbi:SH3 domain-containing protein [Azospirillum sp. SYSU D00513]|uniref:SH3 domain-containing protein n=1 Tax=Azospirillum sp. SYSU D00513 TaxID=2812561 RepID=UPI001A95EF63|nr:SH3 domain-containing protein [Azospirillum sp. SYSU D00513]
MRPFLAAAAAALLLPAPLAAQSPSDSLLRNQMRITNQAVGSQIRDAQRPSAGNAATRAAVTGAGMTVVVPAAILRAGPTTESSVLGVLYRGTPLTLTGPVQDGWAPVSHEGRAGYVSTRLLAPAG